MDRKEPDENTERLSIDDYDSVCPSCQEKERELKAAVDLVNQMTERVNKANEAIQILNTKIEEQDATILRLNNGIVAAARVGAKVGL